MSTPPQPPPIAVSLPRAQRPLTGMSVRAGAFTLAKGAARYDWRDPYHIAISLRWPSFLAVFVVLELGINFLFAALYLAQPGSIANARPGSYSDAFFFSLETLATVGYGAMSPATLYGHCISAVEIISGLAFIAIMTGLTFVRFSRAKARILYADRPVVATYNGRATLMVRIANGRVTAMVDANAKLSALIGEKTQEGQFYRRIHDLTLVRAQLPIFPLTWTLMHEIDEKSPLRRFDLQSLKDSQIRLFVSLKARDLALATDVFDIKDYGADEIAVGMRYSDAVSIDPNGNTIADLTRLSLLELDTGTNFAAAAA